MTEAIQISPEEVYLKVKSGEAILVCAHNDDEEYRRINFEGSISPKYIISLLGCHIDRREISFSFTPTTKISRYTRNDNSTWKFPNCGIKYVTEFMNQCT